MEVKLFCADVVGGSPPVRVRRSQAKHDYHRGVEQ